MHAILWSDKWEFAPIHSGIPTVTLSAGFRIQGVVPERRFREAVASLAPNPAQNCLLFLGNRRRQGATSK
jgi:hypothetical protein